jgi:hypothetical protein
MSTDLASFIEAGLALDPDERAVAAHRLLSSLHEEHAPDQNVVDAVWADEVGRRLDEVLGGQAELVSVAESHAQLRAELAARRR